MQPIDLSVPQYKIGEHMAVYEDTTARMLSNDIAKLPADAFTPLNKEVDSHLFTKSAFWYRFQVTNPTDTPVARLVVLGIPWLDQINIGVIDRNGTRSCYKAGDTYPFDKRAVKDHLPNIEHRFMPGISTVYVRVETRDPFIVPVSVMDRETFLEYAAHHSGLIGFIYGMIVAMMLYNLFLFLSIKTRYYAFYVLYLGFFLAMNASYKCYTFEWFLYDNPTLQNWAESTTIYLFSISGLLFAQSFLNLKEYFPKINRATNWLLLFYTGMMGTMFFAGYHYHVMFSIMLSVVFSLYMFAVGFYALLRGYRFARFFLLGTSAGLVGTAMTALTVMAVLPYSDMGFHAIDYGLVIDAILLSLALAERVKIVQKEKMIAQMEAKTDALTGLMNRRGYYEIAAAEVSRIRRYGGELSLILIDIDFFKKVNDTYGHPGGDAVLKEISLLLLSLVRENDSVFRFGGEEFLILLPETGMGHAIRLAERIRMALERHETLFQNQVIRVTASIGISGYRGEETDIEETEKRADKRLYKAKQSGRNQIVSEG